MTQQASEKFMGEAVGRLVQGDPWKAQDKDAQGNLRVVKSGPNAGQPNPQFFIAVAYPKMDPQNPSQPNPLFGNFYAIVDRVARTAWPNLFPNGGNCILQSFAWKVIDGDALDTKGKSNADKEGFAGHWVVRYASSFPPKILQKRGGVYVQLTEAESSLLKRGYYVRVAGNVAGNNSSQTPGLYVNMDQIEIIAPGEEIVGGMDPNEAFGAPVVLPVGVTAFPQGGPAPNVPGAPGAAPSPAGGLPVAGNMPGAPGVAPQPQNPMQAGAPGAVAQSPAPNPSMQAPAPTGASPAMVTSPSNAPPPPGTGPAPHASYIPAPVMTAAAGGTTYEAYIQAGWTDEQLIANGLMIA